MFKWWHTAIISHQNILCTVYFFTLVSLKFNIPEDRRLDLKVYDQSNTEVDCEVFEELIRVPWTFPSFIGQ